jgi:hypothetical protein
MDLFHGIAFPPANLGQNALFAVDIPQIVMDGFHIRSKSPALSLPSADLLPFLVIQAIIGNFVINLD